MSTGRNSHSSAPSDRQSFPAFLKPRLYAILSHLGLTLFVIISAYLVVLLANRSINGDLFFLIELVALLIFLVYFLLCPFLGLILPVISSKITRSNFIGCWLILLLMSAGTFLFGFLLQDGQLLAESPPAFLAPALTRLDSLSPAFGIYLILYGGGAFLCYTYYIRARLVWPAGLLKMLLGSIFILAVVCWATYNAWVNDDDPFLLSLACFVIQFVGLGLSLLFGITKVYVFARSQTGRMKPFFVPLYILYGILAVSGILLIISCFGIPNILGDLVDSLIYKFPAKTSRMLQRHTSILNHEFVRFFMGLCLLFLNGGGVFGVLYVQAEQCKYCGRYACNRSTDTEETSAVTGRERVTEKASFLTYDRYGYLEDTTITTDDYETVSGTTNYKDHCVYCGKYLGSGSYKWHHTRKTNSNSTRNVDYHPWH